MHSTGVKTRNMAAQQGDQTTSDMEERDRESQQDIPQMALFKKK